MDAFCPRCQTPVSLPDDVAAASGVCPSCGGQVTTGEPPRSDVIARVQAIADDNIRRFGLLEVD